MKTKLLSVLMVVVLLTLAGCGKGAGIARSEKQRLTSPNVNEVDLADLVNGNSAFAFSGYRALKEENGNLFYSPYSISLALAMTYAGARGETEQQMADTLHFILSQDRLLPRSTAWTWNSPAASFVPFGLDRPSLTAEVRLGDGSRHSLEVGDHTPTQTSYYARRGGEQAVLLVESTTVDHLRRLATVPPEKPTPTPTPVPADTPAPTGEG